MEIQQMKLMNNLPNNLEFNKFTLITRLKQIIPKIRGEKNIQHYLFIITKKDRIFEKQKKGSLEK